MVSALTQGFTTFRTDFSVLSRQSGLGPYFFLAILASSPLPACDIALVPGWFWFFSSTTVTIDSGLHLCVLYVSSISSNKITEAA